MIPFAVLSQPQFSSNFSQGSLDHAKVLNETTVELRLKDSASGWFFFRVDNIQNRSLTFVLPNAPANFFTGYSFPVVSYNQTHWFHCKDITILPNEGADTVRYSFSFRFVEDRAWIAFSPPCTNLHADAFIASLVDQPHITVREPFHSVQHDLPISVLSITDPDVPAEEKSRILILSREGGNDASSTWMSIGIVKFLLSGDPAANAVKRRSVIDLVPVFDRDAVESGRMNHPRNATLTVDWKTAWDEKHYSFYEQRQFKSFLQEIKNSSGDVNLCLRLESNWNGRDRIQRELVAKDNEETQDRLAVEILEKKYLPWYTNIERQSVSGRLSNIIHHLFPQAISISLSSNFVYENQFGSQYILPKSIDDMMTEGALVIYALADSLGVAASDPPPFLHGAELFRTPMQSGESFHVRCIYRDILNRAPQFVNVVINDKEYELKPADSSNQNYRQGVLYTGFFALDRLVNSHYFTASNGTKTTQIPNTGVRPGPHVIPPNQNG